MSNPAISFAPAKRLKCKASIQIEGLTGDGKSGLALTLGYFLANKKWDKVFDIDTENNSVNLFSSIPFSAGGTFGEFMQGQLTEVLGYSPSNYLAFRKAAIEAGAEVVIEDSISHAWTYKGGVLDLVNDATNRTTKADKFGAWRDPVVADEKHKLLALLRDKDVHVISTVRIKEKFGMDNVEGKNKVISLGEQQIMQDDIKYEPDLVLRMVSPGSAKTHPRAEVIKTRYAILEKGMTYEFTPELCEQLRSYLEDGADPGEMIEQQRLEYVSAVKAAIAAKPNLKAVWLVNVDNKGYKGTTVDNLPVDVLRELYATVFMD